MSISGTSYTPRFLTPVTQEPSPLEEDRFSSLLDKWMQDPSVEGNKIQAAAKIRQIYERKFPLLNLTNLNLTSLPEGIFTFLSHLEYVHLEDNQLRAFEAVLPNLVQLHLQNNKLETVSIVAPKLKILGLDNNLLTAFSADMPELIRLHLQDNKLIKFEANLPKAQYILLKNNHLPSFSITGYPELKFIDLDNNRLQSLLAEDAGAWDPKTSVRLESLAVANNPDLCSLPSLLDWIPCLQSIYVEGTQIPDNTIWKIFNSSAIVMRNKEKYFLELLKQRNEEKQRELREREEQRLRDEQRARQWNAQQL